MRLIGLLGAKGCGKDTLAKLLIAKLGFVRASFADALYREVSTAYAVPVAFLENRDTKEKPLRRLALIRCKDRDFVRVALRTLKGLRKDSLKHGLKGKLLDPFLTARDLLAARSPRWTMQLWGTEYRRESEFGKDSYWIDQVEDIIKANPDVRYVITDVRFVNEAKMVRRYNGALVRVRRPVLEQKEAEARARGVSTALHPSETQMATYPVDFEVVNVEGQPDLLVTNMSRFIPELSEAT